MKKNKLNIGSGPSGIKGWINVDYGVLPLLTKATWLRELLIFLHLISPSYDVKWPEITLVDIRNEFPFSDASFDYIYCSQVLEHFEAYETKRILKESYRCLKKGGLLRVSIPDINKFINIYQQNCKKDPINAARELNVTIFGHEKDIEPQTIFAKISRKFTRGHLWHYNYASIKQIMRDIGFKKITKCDFRKGRTPDIKRLDISIHQPNSLYVEAEK